MVMSWGEAVGSLSGMDAAVDLAHRLLKLGKGGLGKVSEATIWEVRAVDPLAVILFAAGPQGCGEGSRGYVLRWTTLIPRTPCGPGGRVRRCCARPATR